MSNAPDANWTYKTYTSIASVPASVNPLFDAAPSYFLRRDWFALLELHAQPSSHPPFYLVLFWQQQPVAFLPLLQGAGQRGSLAATWPFAQQLFSAPQRPVCLSNITNFYTFASAPLLRDLSATPLADTNVDDYQLYPQLAQALFDQLQNGALIQFDYLDSQLFNLKLFEASLNQLGLHCVRQPHHPVRYLDTSRASFDSEGFAHYQAHAGKGIRKEYPRKARQLDKQHPCEYLWLTQATDSEQAFALFNQVYEQSWKQPERFPTFIEAFVRQAMASGHMQVAILLIDNTPAAAQIYLSFNGQVAAYKSAYAPAFKQHSPASLLRLFSFKQLFGEGPHGPLTEINFGYGDEAYKKDWLPQKRSLFSLTVINRQRLLGRKCEAYLRWQLAKQVAGRWLKERLKQS